MAARRFTVLLSLPNKMGSVVDCLEITVASQGWTKKEAVENIKQEKQERKG